MLIRANWEGDKIKVLHAQNVNGISDYCLDLAKDQSNGFTKDRRMRRIGSFPVFALMEYDRLNPGWMKEATCGSDLQTKQKAWKRFLSSEYAKPFMMVEKMLH